MIQVTVSYSKLIETDLTDHIRLKVDYAAKLWEEPSQGSFSTFLVYDDGLAALLRSHLSDQRTIRSLLGDLEGDSFRASVVLNRVVLKLNRLVGARSRRVDKGSQRRGRWSFLVADIK